MTGGTMIALVEDDSSMRRAIQRFLAIAGLPVRSFESAESLLSRDLAGDIACLVVDIHLPGASGLDLIERLHDTGLQFPVIFLTAYDEPAARQRAARLGCSAYLVKPFEGEELLCAIAQAREGGVGCRTGDQYGPSDG
jgi:FixJ family two-component response regulator